jgi:hypothetical protein
LHHASPTRGKFKSNWFAKAIDNRVFCGSSAAVWKMDAIYETIGALDNFSLCIHNNADT